MTTHQLKRCSHCGTRYSYQGSGHGCNAPLNDSTWCPQCKQAVIDALRPLPRLFECRYRNIQELPGFADVTLEKLLEWEAVQLNPKGEVFFPVGQRIWPGLYNLETGDSQKTRQIIGPRGTFRLSTWRKDPEVIIDTPMEWDLTTSTWTGHRYP